MKKGKCNFRKWGSYDNIHGLIIHKWYCKTHRVQFETPKKKRAKETMKEHRKEMKKHAKR